MMTREDFEKLKKQTLKHYWGFSEFRENQEKIIDSIISGKDTLALLPTGGGKSLCYQLPALLLEGICLVISPLIALMNDQVNYLLSLGIEAQLLSSDLDEIAMEDILLKCKNGEVKILYLAPERLTSKQFLQHIEEIQISFIAVDEAHCISEWGQDFRPSYQNIKDFRNNIKQVPIIALTATATPKVIDEIQHKLSLDNISIYKTSFNRTNINISVLEIADKFQQILNWLRNNSQSGIIYTRTRKEAETLTRFLQENNIVNCDFYHAGLSAKERQNKQNIWVQQNNQVLVATNAFGMGIDKDNVRFVIHFSLPSSIENYYQEIGRAGRDGKPSHAFLLWNEQELEKFDDILANSIPNNKEFERIISHLYSLFQIADLELAEDFFQLNYQSLQRITKSSIAKIKNVLQFMYHQELIFLNDYRTNSSLNLKINIDDLDSLRKKDSYFIELLFRNLPGIGSQKVYFSEQSLSEKLGISLFVFKERLKDLQRNNLLEYIDGDLSSIKFLVQRNDRLFSTQYYQLFKKIQKNKIQKWEEMKFFVRNHDYCKMKMILTYF
ncbi:MAG: ATP-dependent DNA helicase RecQ, partial [Bacteroidetes bacterium]|nr:ATP-dependent DNA helicase RecQ [Bacteroidota bacterium]